jgi:hypothetical protein
VDLYSHSPIRLRLHGVVLNYLSTGTTLPLFHDGDGNVVNIDRGEGAKIKYSIRCTVRIVY